MAKGESNMPWGYYELDPTYVGPDWREKLKPTPTRFINLNKTYVLVGCEPDTMFRPGTEPKDFDFFWHDNSMMPHLRYPSASNPTANKLWSRLTYRGWSVPQDYVPDKQHRNRVNLLLQDFSQGKIQDISDLWGGMRDTRPIKHRKALIIRSSERNYHEFYGTTWDEYWAKLKPVLDKWGFQYTIRSKVGVKARIGNQITDQIHSGGFDCVIANHSAGASEAIVTGTPVISTSPWNPAHRVSTPWEHFAATGEIIPRSAQEIDVWVDSICAYTYHRTELNTLSWIDTHPNAAHLKEIRYGSART